MAQHDFGRTLVGHGFWAWEARQVGQVGQVHVMSSIKPLSFVNYRVNTMTCDSCKKNPATVFLTQIIDGKMQKVNLCEHCSKEKGVTDPTSFAFLDLLKGLGTAKVIDSTQGSPRCPVCGFSQADLKKTGRLGCSQCYQVFDENLRGILKGMHRGTEHVGKFPPTARRDKIVREKLTTLQDDLRKAVETENYESAATIRDQIRKLEAENVGSPHQ